MPQMLASIILISLLGLHAQTARLSPVEFQGHFIGESIGEFLRIEPEARRVVDDCQQHNVQPMCKSLQAALKQGQRAEISTSEAAVFVLDGGRVVKLTVLVKDGLYGAMADDLRSQLGPRTSETVFPIENALGAKWENHLSVWDTRDLYVTLKENNNPTSRERHVVLVVESQAEHARERADTVKQ
jgi:hypothetical protein